MCYQLQGGIALPLVTPWRQDNNNDDNNNNNNDSNNNDSQNDSNNNNKDNNVPNSSNNEPSHEQQQQSYLSQGYPYNRLSLLLPTSMIGDRPIDPSLTNTLTLSINSQIIHPLYLLPINTPSTPF